MTSETETPAAALLRIAQTRENLDREQFAAVLDARLARLTWAEIGHALGLTPQAVQQRYGRRRAPAGDPADVQATFAGLMDRPFDSQGS